MQQRAPSLSARRWAQYHLLLDVLERRVPRSLRLRYEDLAADPDAAVARVAALTGPRVAAPTGAGGRRAATGHSVGGNPVRFEGPRPVRPDLAWVDEMAPRDRRLVTALTAPLLARYGYLGPGGANTLTRRRRR